MKRTSLSIVKNDEFDLENLYKLYPRKGEGKKMGMIRLKRIITSQAVYDRFLVAVANYAELCRKEARERQYTKLWPTFVNCWEDYECAEELGIKTQMYESF